MVAIASNVKAICGLSKLDLWRPMSVEAGSTETP